MGSKRQRSHKTSSGARKARANKGINGKRRSPAPANEQTMEFIRHQNLNRWPTEESLQKQWELEQDKQASRPPVGRIKPADLGFPLLEQAVSTEQKELSIKKLLVAAALKLKRVKRHPGWVLQRTYNLGKRPLEFV